MSPRPRIWATTRIWITDVTMMPKKPITWSAVAKSSSFWISAAATSSTAEAIMPSKPIAAKTIRSTHSSTISRSAPANRSTRMLRRPAPQLRGDGLEVRRQGAQRRQRPDHFLLQLLLEHVRLLVGQLGEERGRLVRDVERGIDGAQRPLEREQRTREHRHRARHLEAVALHHVEHQAHRLRIEAARPEALREHQADVGFERAAVAPFVAAREVHGQRARAPPGR